MPVVIFTRRLTDFFSCSNKALRFHSLLLSYYIFLNVFVYIYLGLQAHHNPDFFLNGMEEIVQTYYKHASRFLDCTISKMKVFSFFYQAVLELVKQKSVRYGQLIQMVKAKLNDLDI